MDPSSNEQPAGYGQGGAGDGGAPFGQQAQPTGYGGGAGGPGGGGGAAPPSYAKHDPLLRTGSVVGLQLMARELNAKSDAPSTYALIFLKTFGHHDWIPVGKTDTSSPTRDPNFRGNISVSYCFDRFQELRIAVFERMNDSDDISQQELVGSADVLLGKVICSDPSNPFRVELRNVNAQRRPGFVLVVPLAGSDPAARFFKLSFALSDPPTAASMAQAGRGATRQQPGSIMNRFHRKQGASGQQNTSSTAAATSPKLYISVAPMTDDPEGSYGRGAGAMGPVDPSTFTTVCGSDALMLGPSPPDGTPVRLQGNFPDIEIMAKKLNGGDDNRLLFLYVYNGHDYIGGVVSSVNTLKGLSPGTPLVLNERGSTLIFYQISVRQVPSFADYLIRGEVNLNLMVAVDFTTSNGDPNQPGTLHSLVPGPPNQYEAAMRTIANILLPNCHHEDIPAYGYGAKTAPSWNVSHCFAMTGDAARYTVYGVEGLVGAYKGALSNVQLHGPTVFTETLRTAIAIGAQLSSTFTQSVQYLVLVIFTDGVMSDGDTFVHELMTSGGNLPISVVIIGLGHEDFSKMYMYMKPPLKSGNQTAPRPMTTFTTLKDSDNNLSTMASKALADIPEQVMTYMHKLQGSQPPAQ